MRMLRQLNEQGSTITVVRWPNASENADGLVKPHLWVDRLANEKYCLTFKLLHFIRQLLSVIII